MDKRRTQRILGILVIIALVIILFPLLFSKNEMNTQTTSITAPAFPDKQNASSSVSTAENQDTVNTTPIPINSNDNNIADAKPETTPEAAIDPIPTNADANSTPIANAADTNTTSAESNNASSDLANPAKPAAEQTNTIKSNEEAKNDIQTSIEPVAMPKDEDNTNQTVPKTVVTKQPLKSSKSNSKTYYRPAYHKIAKLNKPAWIVQMGSFRNKDNARNLTDKLRAAGFNAFTKEVTTAKGSVRTHVYIGPEFKEAAATKISRKIQHDMNLQSIVLPYKPLAL